MRGRGKAIPTEAWRNVGSTKQAGKWGCRCEKGRQRESLGLGNRGACSHHRLVGRAETVSLLLGALIYVCAVEWICFWVYLEVLARQEVDAWVVIATATISVEIVAKETVVMTMMAGTRDR